MLLYWFVSPYFQPIKSFFILFSLHYIPFPLTETHVIKEHPFEFEDHPINGQNYRTLAWSRIDIDFESNEALIEEIQSDWIKLSLFEGLTIEQLTQNREGRTTVNQQSIKITKCEEEGFIKYLNNVLMPYAKIWDEAMLSATIFFLKEELGIKNIFYHTFNTGNKLKDISYRLPPKSLYTSLPRKFCFQVTDKVPKFLQKDKRIMLTLNKYEGKFHILNFDL